MLRCFRRGGELDFTRIRPCIVRDVLQLPRPLFDLARCQVLEARSNSTTARRGLVCLPKRKYCHHVFRRDRAQTVHDIRRRIFDRWLHGCEGLHCDVVDKLPSNKSKRLSVEYSVEGMGVLHYLSRSRFRLCLALQPQLPQLLSAFE